MNLDFFDNRPTQRLNYDLILEFIEPKSRVLDLGCFDGKLLQMLQKEKQVKGIGIEIDQNSVIEALQKGLSIIQGDIDNGLSQFADQSFDYVILNQTLQSTHKPDFVIDEMLRVGKRVVVSFPNFAYWKVRLYLLLKGEMPKSSSLPYEWYDTPNIHLLTIKDFFNFAKSKNIRIIQSVFMENQLKSLVTQNKLLANLLCDEAIFVISNTVL